MFDTGRWEALRSLLINIQPTQVLNSSFAANQIENVFNKLNIVGVCKVDFRANISLCCSGGSFFSEATTHLPGKGG